jgi:hypothetical protein
VRRWKWDRVNPHNRLKPGSRQYPDNRRNLGSLKLVNRRNSGKKLSRVDRLAKARQRLIKVWAASV